MSAPADSPILTDAERRAVGAELDPYRLVSAAQLADLLGVSRATVYNQIARGMPSIAIGRARRFNVAACMAFLESASAA